MFERFHWMSWVESRWNWPMKRQWNDHKNKVMQLLVTVSCDVFLNYFGFAQTSKYFLYVIARSITRIQMKNKRYHALGTVPEWKGKSWKQEEDRYPNTHYHPFSWLGTATSITSGVVKPSSKWNYVVVQVFSTCKGNANICIYLGEQRCLMNALIDMNF